MPISIILRLIPIKFETMKPPTECTTSPMKRQTRSGSSPYGVRIRYIQQMKHTQQLQNISSHTCTARWPRAGWRRLQQRRQPPIRPWPPDPRFFFSRYSRKIFKQFSPLKRSKNVYGIKPCLQYRTVLYGIGSKRKASNSRIRPNRIRYCYVPLCFNGFSTLCPVCRTPFLHSFLCSATAAKICIST